jgi:trimeric autotransporter adhesin
MALTDNIVSYWKFDESSGNASDSVGSNTLSPVNSATFAAGKINNAASVSVASSQSFEIADAAQSGLDFSDNMTISLWIYPISWKRDTSDDSIVSKWISDGSSAYNLLFWSAGEGGGQIKFFTSSNGYEYESSVAYCSYDLIENNWYHVVVTKNGTTVVFYVNGNPVSTSGSAVATIANTTSPFKIGNSRNLNTSGTTGKIDEVGVWNRAISSSEVTSLYNSGSGIQYPFIDNSSINNMFFQFA